MLMSRSLSSVVYSNRVKEKMVLLSRTPTPNKFKLLFLILLSDFIKTAEF
jgi:hypothetical protein